MLILDFGFWMGVINFGFWILNGGLKTMLNVGFWILNGGLKTMLNVGFRGFEFYFDILLDFGLAPPTADSFRTWKPISFLGGSEAGVTNG
jgi:hypothetical protein